MAAQTITTRDYAHGFACIALGILGIVAFAVSQFTSGRLIVLITAGGVLGFIVALATLARRFRRRSAGKVIAVALFAAVAGSYAILFPLVFFLQDWIANETRSFFQMQPLSAEAARASADPQVEPLDLATPDGARLRGWLVGNSAGARSPLVLYFDGSGSESSRMVRYVQQLKGWRVAVVNYRGFGASEGIPSQARAFADATLLYDTLARRADVDAGRIVAMGYSLGTGVAVYLSEQRATAGTVLVAPYDTLTLIGVKRSLVYAPLSGIMKHYFDSISRAPAIQSPLFCLVGSADPVIPNDLSLRLVGQWGGRTAVKTYPGEDHDLLLHDNTSWADIADFLRGIESK